MVRNYRLAHILQPRLGPKVAKLFWVITHFLCLSLIVCLGNSWTRHVLPFCKGSKHSCGFLLQCDTKIANGGQCWNWDNYLVRSHYGTAIPFPSCLIMCPFSWHFLLTRSILCCLIILLSYYLLIKTKVHVSLQLAGNDPKDVFQGWPQCWGRI